MFEAKLRCDYDPINAKPLNAKHISFRLDPDTVPVMIFQAFVNARFVLLPSARDDSQ